MNIYISLLLKFNKSLLLLFSTSLPRPQPTIYVAVVSVCCVLSTLQIICTYNSGTGENDASDISIFLNWFTITNFVTILSFRTINDIKINVYF